MKKLYLLSMSCIKTCSMQNSLFSVVNGSVKKMLSLALLGILVPCLSWSQGFYISGNQLRDANGNNFIMKGFAVPTAWFVSDVNNNIANMKNKTGANCMRIVCTTSMNENDWKTTVQNCINNKIIPMVELHDVTCINDWNRLNDMAKYWAARASYFNSSGIAKYILINIANEWGDGSQSNSNWREAYKTAITTIRNAGINTTLVIDAPGCGQDFNNASTIRTYGWDLLNFDPKHNLLFSVHMYGVWTPGSNSDPQTGIQLLRNSGLPFIVGEFADRGSFGDYDETKVLSTCASVGAGWLAWSWKGNNEPILDMSNDWAGNNLTNWGNTAVFWNSQGTKSASTASVFSGSSGCGTSNGFPICCNGSASDPDGDGWGWENNASCVVQSSSGSVANGTYRITARHSGLSLNVEGASTADGGNVIQWPYGGANNEKWFVQNLGGGVYSIKNVNSGRSLDVYNASTADGADINQWYYSGNNNQKWYIQSVGSGYYKIVSVNSNKCIDVYNASTAQGTAIDQWTCNGNNNQSFAFAQLSTAISREGNLDEVAEGQELTVHPNPSSGSFTVTESGAFDYVIQNATGGVVEKGQGSDEVSVGKALSSGVYILQVKSAKGSKQVKLLKN